MNIPKNKEEKIKEILEKLEYDSHIDTLFRWKEDRVVKVGFHLRLLAKKGDALKLAREKKTEYKGMFVWCAGKIFNLSKLVYFYHHGKLPDGFHILHKDGDSFNCRIENLELKIQGKIKKQERSKKFRETVLFNETHRLQKRMLWSAKHRARLKKIPCDISFEDIIIPKFCPILKIPLVTSSGKSSENSPSLDRIIPELGYVLGNIQVISHKANTIKSSATVEEMINFSKWVLENFRDR